MWTWSFVRAEILSQTGSHFVDGPATSGSSLDSPEEVWRYSSTRNVAVGRDIITVGWLDLSSFFRFFNSSDIFIGLGVLSWAGFFSWCGSIPCDGLRLLGDVCLLFCFQPFFWSLSSIVSSDSRVRFKLVRWTLCVTLRNALINAKCKGLMIFPDWTRHNEDLIFVKV